MKIHRWAILIALISITLTASNTGSAWEEHSCTNISARELRIVVHGTRHFNPHMAERVHIDIPSSACAITPAAYYDLFIDTKENPHIYQMLQTAVVSKAKVTIGYDAHQAEGWYYAVTSIAIVGYN